MPKLALNRVSQVIARVRAQDFNRLGAGNIYLRAHSFYRKALDGTLTGQDKRDAFEFYKLSLQMERSTDARARLALLGFELEIPGNGWIQGRKFEADMAPRNDFEKKVNDKDPNSELVARGQDWTVEIPAAADRFIDVLRTVGEVLRDFPGLTLAVPETAADQKIIILYANHDLASSLAAKLTDRGVDHSAYRPCYDKDGKVIWQLDLVSGRMRFNQSPYQRAGESSEVLINNDRGIVSMSDFAAITDVGTLQYRDHNEDSAIYIKLSDGRELWVVGDGMGGHNNGSLASKEAVEKIPQSLEAGRLLIEAIRDAHQAVAKANQEAVLRGERGGAGTTITAFLLDRTAGTGQIAWVGDSRARVSSEDVEGLLTRDHSQLFYMAGYTLQDQGKRIELPITKAGLEEIEAALDAEEAKERKHVPDYEIRSQGNVILSSVGQERMPTIGLIEFPLGKGDKPAKVAIYSDGLVDGPEKEIKSELAVAEILKKDQPPITTVEELLAYAYSAGTTDNVTALVIKVAEGLNLAELKEISGDKFQQELIARLSDVNYHMTIGDLKHLVQVYLLNPSIVPPELIERTKNRALTSSLPEAVELMRKIDPSIPPVQPMVASPPPLPDPASVPGPGSAVSPQPLATDIVTVGPTTGRDKWVVSIKYDPTNGVLTQDAAMIIGQAFRPKANNGKFTVVLSANFSVSPLNDAKTLELFLQLLEKNIKERKWIRKKDRFYVLYTRQESSGEPRFDVYREGELEAAFIKQHFPE